MTPMISKRLHHLLAYWGKRLLNKPKEMAFTVLFARSLGLLGVPIAWLSPVTINLITLCRGAKEATPFFLLSLLPLVAFVLVNDKNLLWLTPLILTNSIAWGLTLLLLWLRQLMTIIEIAAIASSMIILTLHGIFHNIQGFWTQLFTRYLQPLAATMTTDNVAQLKEIIHNITPFATGLQTLTLLLSALFSLFLAQLWKSQIASESKAASKVDTTLRPSITSLALIISCTLGAFLLNIAALQDCLPVIILPAILAGISLIHALLENHNKKYIWLVLFYSLLFWFSLYLLPMLVILSIIDRSYHLREKIIKN